MIDTVGFYIPIAEADYKKLMTKGIMTQRIDKDTGYVEFEYTNFRVNCSHNYKIQWKVDNRHSLYDPERKTTVEKEGAPYFRLEFSAPKILFGHNLKTISVDLMLDACLIVKEAIEQYSQIEIVGPGRWFVYRVDVCANFVLENKEQVKSYIRYLQRLDYPRRLGNIYKDESLYFPSRHNTLKIYCKGEEFKEHDAKRLFSDDERNTLQKDADNLLRVEVELRKRINYVIGKHEMEYNERFEKFKKCVNLEDFLYAIDVNDELKRVMKTFLAGTETKVMQSLDVFNILSKVKGIRSPKAYYGVYMLIVTNGQNEAKRNVSKSTYYKALKIFRENGISLTVSDKNETEYFLDRGFPADFTLDITAENKYYQLPVSELIYPSNGMGEPC